MKNKLYFYRNLEEFNKYDEQNNNAIKPFIFAETKEMLESETGNIFDITGLVAFSDCNKANIYSGIINLRNLNDNNKIIISEEWVSKGLLYFPTVFDECLPLFEKTEVDIKKPEMKKKILYFYDKNQFEDIIEYCNKKNIPICNFATLQNFNYFKSETVLDITSTIISIDGSPQLVFILEQFFCNSSENIVVIINVEKLKETKKLLRLTFNDYKNISSLYNEIKKPINLNKEDEKPIKVTDIKQSEVEFLFKKINKELIGHKEFKDELISNLKKFLVLNRIGKRKLFSMFLLGKPGLGKTEIGRIISKSLNYDSKLIKINFGNYSSQDALNSLIGSPAGYIGCEGGELGKKISSNKVGVIICDEFEKADSEIKNFFLELLEDGRFTDSMSREYDLNGYVVIFTSNIQNESEFKNKISPEFESRINMICEFVPLTKQQKEEYINYQIKSCIAEMKANKIAVNFKKKDVIVSYEDTDDLREIKNRILNKISELI